MSKFEMLAAMQACMMYLIMYIIDYCLEDEADARELLAVMLVKIEAVPFNVYR